jgi:hypothetical protein
METGTADPSRVIALLNALSWGDVDGIAVKLEEARGCCLALEQPELALKLADAAVALRAADVKTYRRNVETVVSRLGHLR